MKDEKEFKKSLRDKEVPLLVIDQKWHRLFAIHGKTKEIQELENQVNEYLKRQAHLKEQHKDLKKIKKQLMNDIVENMGDLDGRLDENSPVEKKLTENKRLIEEINQRLDDCEDELIELPKTIARANENLMIKSMSYCYDKMHVNANEAKEIADWITSTRIELKKNIIRKQNRDINNREIYAYMHDILGHDIINLFDIRDDIQQEVQKKPKDNGNSKK